MFDFNSKNASDVTQMDAQDSLSLSPNTSELHEIDWSKQPRRRSLTPIPEMRLNDSPVNYRNLPIESSFVQADTSNFRHDVEMPGFHKDEIRVIVGKNKIRIVGESNENSNRKFQDIHKTIDLPTNIDPSSIKVEKSAGNVLLTGREYLEANVTSHKCAIDVPHTVNTSSLKYTVITKHYLIVTGENHNRKRPSGKVTAAGDAADVIDYRKVCELPGLPTESGIRSRLCNDGQLKITVMIQAP